MLALLVSGESLSGDAQRELGVLGLARDSHLAIGRTPERCHRGNEIDREVPQQRVAGGEAEAIVVGPQSFELEQNQDVVGRFDSNLIVRAKIATMSPGSARRRARAHAG